MDDSRYICKIGEIINDYKVIKQIGKGVFGNVYEVSGNKALKIIKNEPRFHKSAKKEIEILNSIKDVNNKIFCTRIEDSFLYKYHMCIVFDLYGKNLYQVLKENKFRGLDINYIKIIGYQLFTCLSYLKEINIIHRDLKPENMVQYKENEIKVIDFGSCYIKNELREHTYIQSRYYRAPEIVLNIQYNYKIDIWSTGCILYELFTGDPLFKSKNENILILDHICLLGEPNILLLDKSKRKYLFFKYNILNNKYNLIDEYIKYVILNKNLNKLNEKIDDIELLDVINKCIKWDSCDRLKPEDIIKNKKGTL